jgi:hypothetical protein
MINFFVKTVRFDEWGSTKLFECIMVLFVGYHGIKGYIDLTRITALATFIASYLALGYYINDISDYFADKKAEKDRGIHHLSKLEAIFTGFVLWSINIISLFFFHPKHFSLFILGCIFLYLVMLGYSLPPLRFKERGLTGLITAAIGQRTLPAIVLISTMENIPGRVFLYIALLTINGLHWIIIHQAIDLKNDEMAGIKTYMRQRTSANLKKVLIYVIFPFEIGLGVLLTFCFFKEPIFWVFLAYWAVLPAFTFLWSHIIESINLFSYDYVPGDNFLFFVFPVSILITYSFSNPTGWVVVAIALVTKWKYLLWQSGNVMALIKMTWNRRIMKINES